MDLQGFLIRTGKTQTQLAQEIGVSVVAVNEWVRGNSTPKHPYCKALLLMGMRLDELFDNETLDAVLSNLNTGLNHSASGEECERIVKEGLFRILGKIK